MSLNNNMEEINEKTEKEKKEEEIKDNYIVDKQFGSQLFAYYLVDEYHIQTVGERIRDLYIYKDGIYVIGTNVIRAEIQRILGSFANRHQKNEIIEKIKDPTTKDRKEFNVSKNLINLDNGVINIENSEITEHDPKNLFFTKIPVAYKKDADCPQVKKFLSEILH